MCQKHSLQVSPRAVSPLQERENTQFSALISGRSLPREAPPTVLLVGVTPPQAALMLPLQGLAKAEGGAKYL